MWVIFPILASVFYCFGGFIQNYLTDVALPKKRAGSLVIAHIPSFIILMIVLFAAFGRIAFMMPLPNALGLILAGAINIIGAAYYYKALQEGDNTDITIFGQISPLISLGLAFVILGESISINQGAGFIFIMVAIAIVIYGNIKSEKHHAANHKVAILTVVSSFFSVLSDIVFAKFLGDATANYNLFAQSFFYFELGSLLAVVMALIFFRSWRKALKRTFFKGHKHNLNFALMLADNTALGIAEILYKFGLIIAPVVALVSPIGKVAGLFTSFFITVFLGRIFPKFIRTKRITKRVILRYFCAGVFIVIGIVMMN